MPIGALKRSKKVAPLSLVTAALATFRGAVKMTMKQINEIVKLRFRFVNKNFILIYFFKLKAIDLVTTSVLTRPHGWGRQGRRLHFSLLILFSFFLFPFLSFFLFFVLFPFFVSFFLFFPLSFGAPWSTQRPPPKYAPELVIMV